MAGKDKRKENSASQQRNEGNLSQSGRRTERPETEDWQLESGQQRMVTRKPETSVAGKESPSFKRQHSSSGLVSRYYYYICFFCFLSMILLRDFLLPSSWFSSSNSLFGKKKSHHETSKSVNDLCPPFLTFASHVPLHMSFSPYLNSPSRSLCNWINVIAFFALLLFIAGRSSTRSEDASTTSLGLSTTFDSGHLSGGAWSCVVCCQRVPGPSRKEFYAIGPCDHPVCVECSTKMRVLCDQDECAICRGEITKVCLHLWYSFIPRYPFIPLIFLQM